MRTVWYEKMIALIPSWVVRDPDGKMAAMFKAAAELFSSMQTVLTEHLRETFIDSAEGDFLSLIGDGRGRPRTENEPDTVYRARIRSVTNLSTCDEIKKIVDPFLITGESDVSESSPVFFDGTTFIGFNFFLNSADEENIFNVIVPKQITPLGFFYDTNSFYDDNIFYSSVDAPDYIFDNIKITVENEKAYGTMWRFIERRA